MHRPRRAAKWIAVSAKTAAIYVVLTVVLPIPSHGPVQFRVSEMMTLLVFFNPIFAPGIIVGCLIANMFSELNIILDMTLGTLATALSLFFIRRSPNLFIASLFPTIFNGLIIGLVLMLSLDAQNTLAGFLTYAGFVAFGQFVVLTLVGYTLFRILQNTNPKFIQYIRRI